MFGVFDIEGRKYLDCLSSYSALNQGHCHPKILASAIEQAKKLTLTSRAFRNTELPLLYRELSELTGMQRALVMNSGAEAVETAIKAARKWAYKVKGVEKDAAEIIVCENNFHGRTTTIVGFSTEEKYKDGFGPFTPGFKVIPYGDLSALEQAFSKNTAAFLVEPIQGEGGIVIPPDAYLESARKLCAESNALFIVDEIQTGLGRTGKMFAYQYENLTPDAVILGKALSGGFYPVSAVVSTEAVLGLFEPGEHGSTFGGNPLGSAIARAALKVIVEENLVERSKNLGEAFSNRLQGISSSLIKEVRGKGLMIGIELNQPARGYCERLLESGLLCKETRENVIRFAPPLVITGEELDWAFQRIEEVLIVG